MSIVPDGATIANTVSIKIVQNISDARGEGRLADDY